MLNEVILYFNRYVINEAFVLHQTNVINNSSLLKFISGQNISSGANARYQRRFLSMLCSVLALNPLSPNSDKHLISPYNIPTWSKVQVMRIEEMITKHEM